MKSIAPLPQREFPPPPADLSDAAQGDWPGLVLDLAAATGASLVDMALLADVLRARDRLRQVRAVLDRDGPTVTGSRGQTRPHPLLVTESVLRREVRDGFARLRLAPDERHRVRGVDAAGRLVGGIR